MSNITDYMGGAGLPVLDLAKAVPDDDLSLVPYSHGFNAQKGDKSYFYCKYSEIGFIDDAGSLVWSLSPSDIVAAADAFMPPGYYDPSADRLYLVLQDQYSALYTCTVNTVDGSVSAVSSGPTTVNINRNQYYLYNDVYSKSGDIVTVTNAWDKFAFSFDVTTGDITDLSSTDFIPDDKIQMMYFECTDPIGVKMFMAIDKKGSKVSKIIQTAENLDAVVNYDVSAVRFGDYYFLCRYDANTTYSARLDNPLYGAYKAAEFEAAVNKVLRQLKINRTMLS